LLWSPSPLNFCIIIRGDTQGGATEAWEPVWMGGQVGMPVVEPPPPPFLHRLCYVRDYLNNGGVCIRRLCVKIVHGHWSVNTDDESVLQEVPVSYTQLCCGLD
jgi:hypothetical protein